MARDELAAWKLEPLYCVMGSPDAWQACAIDFAGAWHRQKAWLRIRWNAARATGSDEKRGWLGIKSLNPAAYQASRRIDESPLISSLWLRLKSYSIDRFCAAILALPWASETMGWL
ncbi:hypothetical protein [Sphingomonas sp.]|uniref:hypothetical protein n=1 Tax=Sphingomonas sp. TaxID=28214 RepID=UPI003F700B26